MIAITSFFGSAVLLALLVLFRRFEMKRESRILSGPRKYLDRFAVSVVILFGQTLPKMVAKSVKYVIIHITDFFSSILLKIVQFTESKLHGFVHAVRGKKEVNGNGSNSSYFKDVMEHKKRVSKTIEELEKENV